MTMMPPQVAVRKLLFLVVALLFALAGEGEAKELEGYVTTLQDSPKSFAECLVRAAQWKGSGPLRISSPEDNKEAVQTLLLDGITRAWIGAKQEYPGSLKYLWVSTAISPTVGASSSSTSTMNYTNWAPYRPAGATRNGAVLLDATTGMWIDAEEHQQLPCLVYVPSFNTTKTIELPEFEFPPVEALVPKRPAWATSVIVVCCVLLLALVTAAAVLAIWHYRTPVPEKGGKGGDGSSPGGWVSVPISNLDDHPANTMKPHHSNRSPSPRTKGFTTDELDSKRGAPTRRYSPSSRLPSVSPSTVDDRDSRRASRRSSASAATSRHRHRHHQRGGGGGGGRNDSYCSSPSTRSNDDASSSRSTSSRSSSSYSDSDSGGSDRPATRRRRGVVNDRRRSTGSSRRRGSRRSNNVSSNGNGSFVASEDEVRFPGGGKEEPAEVLRYLDPEEIAATQGALGKPIEASFPDLLLTADDKKIKLQQLQAGASGGGGEPQAMPGGPVLPGLGGLGGAGAGAGAGAGGGAAPGMMMMMSQQPPSSMATQLSGGGASGAAVSHPQQQQQPPPPPPPQAQPQAEAPMQPPPPPRPQQPSAPPVMAARKAAAPAPASPPKQAGGYRPPTGGPMGGGGNRPPPPSSAAPARGAPKKLPGGKMAGGMPMPMGGGPTAAAAGKKKAMAPAMMTMNAAKKRPAAPAGAGAGVPPALAMTKKRAPPPPRQM